MQHPKTIKLGEIAHVTSGGTPDRKKSEYYAGGTIPWVKTGDLKVRDLFNAGEHITELGVKNSSATIFPVNTVLIALYGATIGASSILKIPAATNQACGAIMPSQSLIPDFLYYYVVANREKLVEAGVGGAQPNISGQILKNLKIPLPDLNTQRHIAAILDRADAIRQKDRQLLSYYEQLPQAVFLEMFGDPVGNEKGWEVRAAKELIHDIVAGDSYGGDERLLQDNELGVLKVSAVTSGYFRSDEYKAVPVSAIRKAVVKPRAGDLLFSRANTRELVAATCIVDQDYENVFLPDKLWRIDLKKERVNPYYVKMLLSHRRFRDSLTKTATGTSGSMLNVSMEKLKSLKMPVPVVELQNEFAFAINAIEQQKVIVKHQLATSEALFQSLLHESFGENSYI